MVKYAKKIFIWFFIGCVTGAITTAIVTARFENIRNDKKKGTVAVKNISGSSLDIDRISQRGESCFLSTSTTGEGKNEIEISERIFPDAAAWLDKKIAIQATYSTNHYGSISTWYRFGSLSIGAGVDIGSHFGVFAGAQYLFSVH